MSHLPHRPRPQPHGLSARRLTPLLALISLLALLLLVPACATDSTTPGGDPPGGDPPGDTTPGDDPPTDPEGPYYVMGYSLYTADPTIVIHPTVGGARDTSRPLADAVVTVNGVLLAYDSDHGQYRGSLPAASAAGDTVEVEIEVGDERIEASGVVPGLPNITAPATAAHFEPGDAIEIAWSLAEDPDRYRFHIRDSASISHWPGTDDGAARSITLPSSLVAALPDDSTPIMYQVLAINDGEFSGPAHPSSSLGLEARTQLNRFFTLGADLPTENYYVEGLVMGSRYQNLIVQVARNDVRDETQPAPDIVGNVNGEPLSLFEPTGRYSAVLPAPVSVGDTLVLHLEGPLGVVDATGVFPAQPTVTYPAPGDRVAGNLPVEIRWTSPSDPSHFAIRLEGGEFTRWSGNIPGTERSYTFPSRDVTMGTDLTIYLSAVNDGEFEGDYADGSSMGITNDATPVTFLRQIYIPPLP